jgi:uncharacterized protein YjbJ (UPF0337 family)
MNRNQLTGKWNRIRGIAKKSLGTLIGDDFKKAEGSMDELYGVIQERIGDTKEAIQAKLDKVHARLHRTTTIMQRRYAAKSAMRSAMYATMYPFFRPQRRDKCCGL